MSLRTTKYYGHKPLTPAEWLKDRGAPPEDCAPFPIHSEEWWHAFAQEYSCHVLGHYILAVQEREEMSL